jgi:Crinkler effector protein N-terminal domain
MRRSRRAQRKRGCERSFHSRRKSRAAKLNGKKGRYQNTEWQSQRYIMMNTCQCGPEARFATYVMTNSWLGCHHVAFNCLISRTVVPLDPLLMSTIISLNCCVFGDDPSRVSSVDIDKNKKVSMLRKAIKDEKKSTFDSIDADKLDLWNANNVPTDVDKRDFQTKLTLLVANEDALRGAK